MRLLRNPVAQYLTLAVAALHRAVGGDLRSSARAWRRDEASADARQLDPRAGPLGGASPRSPAGWSTATPARSTSSTARCSTGCSVGDVRRVKIWRGDGTIVYSDETQLIGAALPARRGRARGPRERRHRGGGLRPLQAREPVRDRAGRPGRGLHPDPRRPRASRCCSRSTTPPTTSSRAAERGVRAVPADHASAALLAMLVHRHADHLGAHPAAHPQRAGSASGCCAPR